MFSVLTVLFVCLFVCCVVFGRGAVLPQPLVCARSAANIKGTRHLWFVCSRYLALCLPLCPSVSHALSIHSFILHCAVSLPWDDMPEPIKCRERVWMNFIRSSLMHGADSDNVVLVGHSTGADACLRCVCVSVCVRVCLCVSVWFYQHL